MSHKSAIENSYTIPRTSPLYGKPPFEYRDSWVMVIPFISSPEIIKELVPEPLVPNSDSMMLLTISRANASGFGRYHEMILDIPSTLDDKSGRYTVYLYLDGDSHCREGRVEISICQLCLCVVD